MTTFVVNDPAVCDQVAELLGPFRSSKPGRPATNDRVRDRQALVEAERRLAHLQEDLGQTQDLLAQSTAKLAAERKAHDETTAKLVTAESDLAQTSRELEGARTELERVRTELERVREELTENRRELTKLRTQPAPATVKPLHGNSTRAKDRDAFAALARRMETNAMSQTKVPAEVLRIAARAVRDEIETVYGTAGKKAS